ncbi:DUF3545 family protein [Vibrio cholerae]|uniref:DUF3545 domain-containing protein n=9 Tax=Pseudomonadota TaxID=1224 RepID=Q9KPL0_VIBCH|nr:hypothetical protein VC_2357 [Vibrio cholerae O1 biovar El Tor str. N16961]ABQ21398.1 hypothetical protein VC0395_A1936 [Vibrio cholerae O395]ACP06581.1 conserved hypothetical protein [Vibrio cholerae M66-2]ACQ60161.1 hypothetical protein VCD_001992 [Vibrio cholerae MJ-1236]ARB80086.1 DUF3545 domain-containing protein [Vibrio cholerae]AVH52479.1 DUF3545 domain-containing protein [Vibrio cholerae O1 biovar El Tor]EAZ75535.1 hypothetical protein A5E_2684 [Vibrio cholerae B33]EEO09027.1 hypo
MCYLESTQGMMTTIMRRLMDELHFDELLEMEISKIRTSRSKPVKRMWREIEAIRDRKRLEKELLDMDVCLDADDIKI